MNEWEIACWGVVIIFIVFGILGIFAVINSSQISREQEPFFDRVAWIKYMLEQEDKE